MAYIPDQYLCVDEMMIKFKGRAPKGLAQFMPNKPIRNGYKLWALAQRGYLLDFTLYLGKDRSKPREGMTLGATVVLDFVECQRSDIWCYINKGHIFVVDNFFSSPALFLLLDEQYGSGAVGTVRTKSGGYDGDTKLSLHQVMAGKKEIKKWVRGQWDYRQYKSVVYALWKDNKIVRLLSNYINYTDVEKDESQVKRKRDDGKSEQFAAPPAVSEYTPNHGGVDQHDQYVSYHNSGRQWRKWWHRIFFWCVKSAAVNAWLLRLWNRNHVAENLSQAKFLEQLCPLLVGNFCARKSTGPAPPPAVLSRANHYLIRSPNNRQGACIRCSTKKRRVRSIYICDQGCGFLCVDCFRPWHLSKPRPDRPVLT